MYRARATSLAIALGEFKKRQTSLTLERQTGPNAVLTSSAEWVEETGVNEVLGIGKEEPRKHNPNMM